MPAQRIRQLGDPILREVCAPVRDVEQALPVLTDLRDTLHEFRRTHGFGRGIAAPQIGVALRVIYLELGGASYCLVNPAYEWRSAETFRLWDDCFSFPDLLVWLERATEVRLSYQDETGRTRELLATGDLAELVQHEIDHLDGILAVDRALDQHSLRTREEHKRQQQTATATKAAS